ncbi:hypothetical protein FA13DRAFT_1718866, partial [Coprinellus micaceus]
MGDKFLLRSLKLAQQPIAYFGFYGPSICPRSSCRQWRSSVEETTAIHAALTPDGSFDPITALTETPGRPPTTSTTPTPSTTTPPTAPAGAEHDDNEEESAQPRHQGGLCAFIGSKADLGYSIPLITAPGYGSSTSALLPTIRSHPTTYALSLSSRRTYPLRRTNSRTSSHAPDEHSISSPAVPNRPVLVPLHNLRRLPSRTFGPTSRNEKDTVMRESSHLVHVGAKRKRVASSNENVNAQARQTRPSPETEERGQRARVQRHGTRSPSRRFADSEEEEVLDGEEEELEEDEETTLGELVRLYRVGGLPEDPELLTKAEIIEVIIEARDEETASLPPSSPPGRTDAASSDYSSDDGN